MPLNINYLLYFYILSCCTKMDNSTYVKDVSKVGIVINLLYIIIECHMH